MKIRIFAVFVTAFVALLAPNVRGQIGPDSSSVLPESLPIGDESTFLNWIVTSANQTLPGPSFVISLFYTNKQGQYKQVAPNMWDWKVNSIDDYLSTVVYESGRLVDYVNETGGAMDGSLVGFVGTVEFGVDTEGFLTLFWSKNFPSFSDISLEALKTPTIKGERVAVPVPGLESLRLDIGTPIPCSYAWTNGYGGTYVDWPADQLQNEPTKPGFVGLSKWYSLRQYRLRVTICAQGLTGTYTQDNALLKEPVIKVVSPRRLDVTMSKGSDVTILSSDDLKTWTVIKSYSWSEGISQDTVAIEPGPTCKFFRSTYR
jgi:hypothetical protein